MLTVNHLFHDYDGKGNYTVKDLTLPFQKAKFSVFLARVGLVKVQCRIF